MFVVVVLLNIFIAAGKPLRGVAWFFAGTVIFGGLLGEVVGRWYSEPMNRFLRTAGEPIDMRLSAAFYRNQKRD
jgi:hypothetical protein